MAPSYRGLLGSRGVQRGLALALRSEPNRARWMPTKPKCITRRQGGGPQGPNGSTSGPLWGPHGSYLSPWGPAMPTSWQ
eukprot:9325263-Pyramimonas_sp.AAC.1